MIAVCRRTLIPVMLLTVRFFFFKLKRMEVTNRIIDKLGIVFLSKLEFCFMLFRVNDQAKLMPKSGRKLIF